MAIRKAFAYHKPSAAAAQKIDRLRHALSELADLFDQLAPASRERSVAHTELENAGMWVVKAIVLNDPDSVVDPDNPTGR